MGLSTQLREETQAQHQRAETSPFIVSLMAGHLSLDHYVRYLINMAWLYDALEDQVERGEPFPGSEELWDERLLRLPSITIDLENFGVFDWREKTAPSEAMASYLTHIASLNGRSDHRLIAHHYTRYLGDLSGGQAIAALMARHYGATPEQLSFYRFDAIDNLVHFKNHYRACLDRVVLSPLQRDQLVSEARGAFERNQRVFEDLHPK